MEAAAVCRSPCATANVARNKPQVRPEWDGLPPLKRPEVYTRSDPSPAFPFQPPPFLIVLIIVQNSVRPVLRI
jgi:hypothetical protein